MEQIEAETYNYQTKKQNPKIQSTFINQLKFNKNEDFYKARFFKAISFLSFLIPRLLSKSRFNNLISISLQYLFKKNHLTNHY